MLNNDILSIKDLPSEINLSDKQIIQIAAIKSGKPQIDKANIRRFLKSLESPVYCLDFETLGVAVPPFDRARPYQKIPFQFSIHVIPQTGLDVEHHTFLADGRNNFAAELISALKVIGPKGTVLAYNMNFERQVLEALKELSPKDAGWLESIAIRLRDLIEPFRAFSYYHPDQHGSCSLKAVLPALTGKSYMGMEIGEGGTGLSSIISLIFETRLRKRRKGLGLLCWNTASWIRKGWLIFCESSKRLVSKKLFNYKHIGNSGDTKQALC